MPNLIISIISGIAIEGFIASVMIGSTVSSQLRTVGHNGAVTWDIYDGSLPDGWTLDASTGLVSGEADDAGSYTVVVRATDRSGRYARKRFSFKVQALPMAISGTLPDAGLGEVYFELLTISGGTAPYTLRSMSGHPPGLSAGVSSSFLSFTGPADLAGQFNITVVVQDADGGRVSRTVELNVVNGFAYEAWLACISWWELDEASGAFIDRKGSSPGFTPYNGSAVGTVTRSRSPLGADLNNCIALASGNNAVEVGGITDLAVSDDVSVLAWIRRNGAQNAATKFVWKRCGGDATGLANYMLFDEAGGYYGFRVTDDSDDSVYDVFTDSYPSNGVPYCFVGRRLGDVLSIWQNAVIGSTTIDLPPSIMLKGTSDSLRIGRTFNDDDSMNADIGPVAVFAAGLSSGAIAYLYNGGAGKTFAQVEAEAGQA